MKTLKNILFYFLSFTWGIVMTLVGCFVCLFLLLTGHKPHKFNRVVYFQIGEEWGGFEVGPFFVCDNTPYLQLKQHEAGHGLQNIALGPFMPFLVSIPSTVRYWLITAIEKDKRDIFVLVMDTIAGIAIATMLACTWCGPLWLAVIAAILCVYVLTIFLWIMCIEAQKYGDDRSTWPEYDDVWFEGSATKLGAKYYPEDK